MPTGNTEVYLLDGPTSLGVFTVNGAGGVVSWYFNVLAGDKAVGRQPSAGDRRHYHTDFLGSTRAVTDSGVILESYDFEPWGMLMPGRALGSGTKEGFTGKEQDAETGLDYFGARYYMPALGRWTTVDPLAGSYPHWSPFAYALDDPLVLIDPDGRSTAPIYDRDGNLLGTDDQGLQGDPIVMDPKNFRQGMSHDEAVKHDLGTSGLRGDAAHQAFRENYQSLPSRPDYDGRLTYDEAIAWYNKGGGRPLYIDARTLDVSMVTVSDVMNDEDGYINLFSILDPTDDTRSVFGTIKFTLLDAETGTVRLGGEGNYLDKYDFKKFSPAGAWARLRPGKATTGKAVIFRIYCSVCTNHVTLDRK